jgi:hypothetical protein
MKIIMQLMGVAPNGRPPPVPTYVQDVDFDADEGRGRIIMTQKRYEAKRFDTPGEALEYYRTQSKVVPIRPDGKPNRPLTAYNVQIMGELEGPQ